MCCICFLGLIIFTGYLTFSLIWVFHTLHLFSSMAFPFKSKKLWQSKSFKWKAHVAELVAIVIYGLIPNVIIIFVGQYVFPGFPLLCVPNIWSFASFFLISNALVSIIGLTLLFLTLWIIRQVCMIAVLCMYSS